MADNLKVRSIIGLGMIFAITGLMVADAKTGHGYGAILLATALTGAGLWEFCRMAQSAGPVFTRTLIVFGVAFTACIGIGYEVEPKLHFLLPVLAIGFCYTVFFALLKGSPSLDRFNGMTASLLGFFYVPFLGGFALAVRFLEPANEVGFWGFFYVITIAKGTDIFAYYFGKSMGKRKIIPSVSPGKTGAGFVGAVVGGVVITGLYSQFTALGEIISLPLVPGVGILMALIGISGDLIESFVKRSVAVKDSANLLPNFGGVLDVIDSVLIAAPPVFFVLYGLNELNQWWLT